MLKMEEIARIKEYRSQGKSKRAICRETGHAWDTVTKYIDKKDFNIYPRKRKPKSTKLDGYRKIIDKWLLEDQDMPRKQRHTATRVHARLKEEFGDDLDVQMKAIMGSMAKMFEIQSWIYEVKESIQKDDLGGYIENILENHTWPEDVTKTPMQEQKYGKGIRILVNMCGDELNQAWGNNWTSKADKAAN